MSSTRRVQNRHVREFVDFEFRPCGGVAMILIHESSHTSNELVIKTDDTLGDTLSCCPNELTYSVLIV